jgi:hypothetical protein
MDHKQLNPIFLGRTRAKKDPSTLLEPLLGKSNNYHGLVEEEEEKRNRIYHQGKLRTNSKCKSLQQHIKPR